MVCYPLDQRTPQSHTKQEAQIFLFTHIRKATKCLKDVTYRSRVCHSVVTMVEWVGVPRQNSGPGHKVGGPKTVLNFCCTCLEMQSNAEHQGLDVDSPATVYIQVKEALACAVARRAGGRWALDELPCHSEPILTEKDKLLANQKRRSHRRKRYPRRNKNLWHRNKVSIK